MKLSGKIAIVTGSSRGIGKAIALAYAREGAAVVVAARSEVARQGLPGTIAETVEQIQALGGRALGVRCDVTQQEDVDRLVTTAVEEFGGLDILVNNAGANSNSRLVRTEPKLWDIVLRVNLTAPYLCCRAAVPRMIVRGGGSIINISSPASQGVYSLVGTLRHRFGIAYGTSKAALERLSIGLAAEVAEHNIAVNALRAGPTITEGVLFFNPNVDPEFWSPPERYMTKAAVFLATQDAKGVTGRVFDDNVLCDEYGLT